MISADVFLKDRSNSDVGYAQQPRKLLAEELQPQN